MEEVDSKVTNDNYTADQYTKGGPNEELQGLIPTTEQTFSTGDQTQVGQAITRIASTTLNYKDTGIVNAYLLSPVKSFYDLGALIDGFLLTFTPLFSNTGAATVNVNGLGIKAIVDVSGAALTGGEIQALATSYLSYDLSNDRFVLLQLNAVDFALKAELAATSDPTGASIIGLDVAGTSISDVQTFLQGGPLLAKARVSEASTVYTLESDGNFNVASVVRNSIGSVTVTYTNPLSRIGIVITTPLLADKITPLNGVGFTTGFNLEIVDVSGAGGSSLADSGFNLIVM